MVPCVLPQLHRSLTTATYFFCPGNTQQTLVLHCSLPARTNQRDLFSRCFDKRRGGVCCLHRFLSLIPQPATLTQQNLISGFQMCSCSSGLQRAAVRNQEERRCFSLLHGGFQVFALIPLFRIKVAFTVTFSH